MSRYRLSDFLIMRLDKTSLAPAAASRYQAAVFSVHYPHCGGGAFYGRLWHVSRGKVDGIAAYGHPMQYVVGARTCR